MEPYFFHIYLGQNERNHFMGKQYLSNREYDVMEALWSTDQPLSAADIVERTGLSQAAVLPVLKRLMNKGFVEISAVIPHAKTYVRIFRATKGKDEIIKKEIEDYLQVAENPLSFARTIMASFLDGTKYSEDMIQELEKLISEKKHGHSD